MISAPDHPSAQDVSAALPAALSYVALDWPVLPGAVWRGGRFVDPADGLPTPDVALRPAGAATTDSSVVRDWWSTDGLHAPSVLVLTGAALGVVSVYGSLVDSITGHPWFLTRPTPVLALPEMPLAYFFVRPPLPSTAIHDAARVLPDGTTLPVPPTSLGGSTASWLVSPEEAGNVLLLGSELADLIRTAGRCGA